MKRRDFISLLGSAAAAWPLAAQAQPADRRPLVGYLVETTKEAHASRIAPFLEGMRDLGYVQGQNVEIAYRFGDFDRARCRRSPKSCCDSTLLSSLPPTPLP